MYFELPRLTYSYAALAGRGMSQETLELHHDKHHRAYVAALNGLVEMKEELREKSLDEIIAASLGRGVADAVFNFHLFDNAGQHWNHLLFWNSLSPEGGRLPGRLEAKLVEDFGSVEAFRDAFRHAALAQFGSGWVWLVLGADGRLKVCRTPNGSNPVATGDGRALLALDVWEHSYYVDFRNRRPDYVTNFLDRLANYEFADAALS